jgi:two-component system, NtrC family, sensor histidine kinase AtoS
MLKFTRSTRFQVIFFTLILIVACNLTLGWILTQSSVQKLTDEKVENLNNHAKYLANIYQTSIEPSLQKDAKKQFDAQSEWDPGKRSYDSIYKDARAFWLEGRLLEKTEFIVNLNEEMGAGFYFSDQKRVMAFRANKEFLGYPRLVASVPIGKDGSFVWVEESTHNLNQKIHDLKQRSQRIIFYTILITLFFGILFAISFTRKIKSILLGLSHLKTNLHEEIPNVGGEMGDIAKGINSLSQSLLRSLGKSELILQSTMTGMISYDKNKNISFINHSAKEYLNLPEEGISGDSVSIILGNMFTSAIDKALTKGDQFNLDGVKKTVDGVDKYFNILVLPNQDPFGEKSVLVTLDDVTENVKLIKEAEKNESLKMLGLFTTGIAHEIRNPLTSIKGFIQILSRKALDNPESTRMFTLVIREIERLESLIKDLITYARPSKPTFEWISLSTIIETILQVLIQRVSQKKVDIEMEGLDSIELFADRRQIYQVIFNLILNAIQAVKPEEGRLLISAKTSEDAIHIHFADNGMGIDKTDTGKIFTPFFTTKDKGTGLGLAISRRMMEDHNGKITFESEQGLGTTFILTLLKYRIKQVVS